MHFEICDSCSLKEIKSVARWIDTKVLQSSLPNLGMKRIRSKMENTNKMKQTKGPNRARFVNSGNKMHDMNENGSQNCDVFQNGFRPVFGDIHS